MTVDYRAYTDCFSRTALVPSTLMHGDPALCAAPFLTIAIPTFRRVDLLKIALDSALSQTDPPFSYEVLVVDNDPPGAELSPTELMLKGYDAPNLLYYKNTENLGIAGNWNRCVTLARGQWVAFLHDDDILLPDYLRRLSRLLSKQADIGGIMALAYELRDDGGLTDASAMPLSRLSKLYDRRSRGKLMRLTQKDSYFLIANAYGAPTCGSVFKRELLLKSGGFNSDHHPSFDWFFLYRFAGQHKLYRTMERVGYYRVFVNESLSDKTKRAFFQQRLDFLSYMAEHSALGRWLRCLFRNEQNLTIYREPYTDYEGKKPEDHFEPEELKERKIRGILFRLITRGYWKTKSYFNLLFG